MILYLSLDTFGEHLRRYLAIYCKYEQVVIVNFTVQGVAIVDIKVTIAIVVYIS